MMKMINALFKKNKEVIMYVVFGALTTVVNFISFWLFSIILGEKLYLINNAIAWIVSVVFAYVTNKLFVFESKGFSVKTLLNEGIKFLMARVVSFLMEELGIWLFVDVLNFNELTFDFYIVSVSGQMVAKVILAVIVVIMNYFFSKFIIFSNKTNQ